MAEEGIAERREVYYSGRVQGVGFRYTCRMIAARFAVAGFVKNLPDGRVQLVAEGETGEIRQFLAAIDAEMGRYVVDTREAAAEATGRFSGFEIRF